MVALFTAFTTVVLKMWKEHTALSKEMIKVISQNASSHEKLVGAIDRLEMVTKENTEVTRTAADATRQTKDSFSQLLFEVLRSNRVDGKTN